MSLSFEWVLNGNSDKFILSTQGMMAHTDLTTMGTQTQSIAGTLLYMPPEQLSSGAGANSALDARSDIFAVGVTSDHRASAQPNGLTDPHVRHA